MSVRRGQNHKQITTTMTRENTYRDKARAVFLAAIMVLSVVAMSAAFAGSVAAAEHDIDVSFSDEEADAGMEVDVSFDFDPAEDPDAEVGAYDVEIHYDADVVSFVDAEGEDLADPVVGDDEDGTLTANVGQATGDPVPLTAATFTFEVDDGAADGDVADIELNDDESSFSDPIDDVSFESTAGSITVGDAPDPANFEIVDVDPSGDFTVEPGADVETEVTVENTGEQEDTQDVEFNFAGDVADSEPLTLEGGEEDSVTVGAVAPADEGDYDWFVATDDDESATWTLTVQDVAADFQIVEEPEFPAALASGDNLSADFTVENQGDGPGEQDVTLELANETDSFVLDSEMVQLDPNESAELSLSGVVDVAPGSYDVSVNTEQDDLSLLQATKITVTDPDDTGAITGDIRDLDTGEPPVGELEDLELELFFRQDGEWQKQADVMVTENWEYTENVPVEADGSEYRVDASLPKYGDFSTEVSVDPGHTERVDVRFVGEEADFQIVDVDFQDPVAEVGDTVRVDATIENQGPASGEQDVTYTLENETDAFVLDSEEVQLDRDDSAEVSLSGDADVDPGDYDQVVSTDDDSVTAELPVTDPGDRGAITGDIRDLDTGEPPEGLEPDDLTLNISFEDDTGEFQFLTQATITDNWEYTEEVPVESDGTLYKVEVDVPTFSDFSREVSIGPEDTERVDVRLLDDIEPQEIVVDGFDGTELVGDKTLLADGSIDNTATYAVASQVQEEVVEFRAGVDDRRVNAPVTVTLTTDDLGEPDVASFVDPATGEPTDELEITIDPDSPVGEIDGDSNWSYETFEVSAAEADEDSMTVNDEIQPFVTNQIVGTPDSDDVADDDPDTSNITYVLEGDQVVTGDVRDGDTQENLEGVTVWAAYDGAMGDHSLENVDDIFVNDDGETFLSTESTEDGYVISGLAGDETDFSLYAKYDDEYNRLDLTDEPAGDHVAFAQSLQTTSEDNIGDTVTKDIPIFEEDNVADGLTISGLSPADAEVEEGESIDVIEAFVTNDGEELEEQTIELRIDGTVVASQDVSLEAGDTEPVSFEDVSTEGLDPGEYEHGVFSDDDSETGTLTITDGNNPWYDEYTEDDGTVEFSGLSAAFSDYGDGEIDFSQLSVIFNAYGSGEPVESLL